VFALLCPRRASFFSRRRAARACRCLAWIFLRRESVILGMGLNPLFVPSRALDAGAASHSELAASSGGSIGPRCQLHSNAKYRSRRPLVKTIDAMLDVRPGRGGEQAISSTRHPFATRALWRCSVVLYSS